jgi:ABC-2 type transport system ATP-binding protein
MVSKTVKCPECKTHISVQGEPGDKITISCPKCNLKGFFKIPEIKLDNESISVQIKNLSKYYKDVKAVDGASFNVIKGEVFGFLGPNGAGKTTTIKAMLGLIHMNTGKVEINGLDITKDDIKIKKDIGYLPERVSFYPNLTPVQTLNFFCELKGVNKSIIPTLLKDVGLDDAADRKVGTFSKGMVQLLGVAQVQIGNPSIYILDEPMSGLDARWVKIIREKIKMLNEQGATVIFSSHILSEVENLCDKVAIIDKGKVIAEDTVSNLNKYLRIKPRLEIYITGLNGIIPEQIKNIDGVENIKADNNKLYVTCDPTIRSQVITSLEKSGLKIENIKTIEPTLEDAFVKLISEKRGVS